MTAATCPRCGGGFDCGAASGAGVDGGTASGACGCFAVALTDSQRGEIARRWAGCLCVACLRELSRPVDGVQPVAPARDAGMMPASCPSSTASLPPASS